MAIQGKPYAVQTDAPPTSTDQTVDTPPTSAVQTDDAPPTSAVQTKPEEDLPMSHPGSVDVHRLQTPPPTQWWVKEASLREQDRTAL